MPATDPARLLDTIIAAAREHSDPMELIELAAEHLASRGDVAPATERSGGRPRIADSSALAEAQRLIAAHVEPAKAILQACRKFAPDGATAASRHRLRRKLKNLDKTRQFCPRG
jgi:hypothetical protein